MAARRPVRRSTRLLQTLAVALFALGVLLILPIPFWADALQTLRTPSALAMLIGGSAGILGLSFTWYRALVTFTLLAWAVALIALIQLVLLIVDCVHHSCQGNPVPWIIWLAAMLTAAPAAVLSSTMHILRVWQSAPLVTDTSEPLVTADAAVAPIPMPNLHAAAAASRQGPAVWPPPAPGAAVTSGAGLSSSDLQAAARVAGAAHSGTGAFSANDLAAAAKVGMAAASTWPPPACPS